MANKNVLGKNVNWSQFKSLMAGIALLVSSWLLNNLQAQEVVTKKQLIKKEQKANEKLDPLFEAPFAYLYGLWVQKHINTEIANQHLDINNLNPAFLTEEVLKILQWNDTKELTPVLTVEQLTKAVEDSVMALLVIDYAKVAQIYINHINSHGNIVLQKNRTEWVDVFNRVALPREAKIDTLMKLFWERWLFGKSGSLGNTKAGKAIAEKTTIELEHIINESLQLIITKFAEYRQSDNELTVEDAVYNATNDGFLSARGKISPKVKAIVAEASAENFRDPTKK